jgi:nitrous oxide reductase accessory protein NosL
MKIFILIIALLVTSYSNDVALYKKGKKIFNTFCDTKELKISSCPKLSSNRLEAVEYYLGNAKESTKTKAIYLSVPKNAKCPVCGMFVYKYPKWSSKIEIDGHSLYFDGVKDMMKYYIFDGDFHYNRDKIDKIIVSDYYTLLPIMAKDAYYVYNSNMFGPMGRELIPFNSLNSAQRFKKDHGGDKILKFNEITDKIIMALDD